MSPMKRRPPPPPHLPEAAPLAPETLMMRTGYNPWWSEGAVKPPLFLTSTFLFKTAEEGEEFFQVALGKKASQGTQGLIYSRLNNPELEILEERLAVWEGAEKASVFASGMAAITTTMLALCRPGDQVAYTVPVYGGTAHFLKEMLTQFGVQSFPIPAGDGALAALEKLDAPNLRLVFVETPSNPSLELSCIRELRAAVDAISERTRREVLLAVDNTMLGPVFQQPLRVGAHLSLYSATKFIGGHSDLIAGAVLGAADLIQQVNAYRSFLGTMGSPFVCWQIMRSLETLKIRMERQAEHATKVAKFLASHPAVTSVHFPGLVTPGTRQAEIAAAQLSGPGSVMSFEVAAGRYAGEPQGAKRRAFEVLNRVQICHLAVSLGGTETLIEHPKTMTHSELGEAEQTACGITDGLIRLSVGLESPDDLIADLKQALRD
jgi:methionine-gamma-lyase